MRILRDPEYGCPWDVAQTFATIAPYTIEEAYEVADACERGDMVALKDELGDLLLQVVFHSRMAEEAGDFAFDDVAMGVADKLIRRHPHVFDDAPRDSGHAQWEVIKAAERAKSDDQSALAGVALALPALMRAEKLQKRASRVGFDWPDISGPRAKIIEELAEVEAAVDHDAREDEIGDLLFAVVNFARHLKIDPEIALRRSNAKFERRFRKVEEFGEASLAGQSIEQLDALWERAKRA
ncbi:MAG TPA: nucleoside triphosphate pyrophosphohydrolase [Sphingomonas sp.]|nr:nucleoside triphosphate pyrophosphohydrolase [Sphingomonas sp.]